MAKGIISRNSSSTFINTEINTDGTGLETDGDNSTFNRLKIYAFEDPELFKLVKTIDLPPNTPGELIQEAYSDLKKSGDAKTLENSKLKKWLLEQGLTVAFWGELSIQLATLALTATAAAT